MSADEDYRRWFGPDKDGNVLDDFELAQAIEADDLTTAFVAAARGWLEALRAQPPTGGVPYRAPVCRVCGIDGFCVECSITPTPAAAPAGGPLGERAAPPLDHDIRCPHCRKVEKCAPTKHEHLCSYCDRYSTFEPPSATPSAPLPFSGHFVADVCGETVYGEPLLHPAIALGTPPARDVNPFGHFPPPDPLPIDSPSAPAVEGVPLGELVSSLAKRLGATQAGVIKALWSLGHLSIKVGDTVTPEVAAQVTAKLDEWKGLTPRELNIAQLEAARRPSPAEGVSLLVHVQKAYAAGRADRQREIVAELLTLRGWFKSASAQEATIIRVTNAPSTPGTGDTP